MDACSGENTNCSCCGLRFCPKPSKVGDSKVKATMEPNDASIQIEVPKIVHANEEKEIKSPEKINMPEVNSPIPGTGGTFLAPPTSKPLLGGDLLNAMPPPTSTLIKKRNLVQPGMSMVKWMNLQASKPRPITRRKIPLSEIQKHDKETDCWMVIRNCVYDVTEYIPYHPGGIPELMKGAGKDATALFNEAHRWVNFDSILRACLQGYLLVEPGESFEENEEEPENKLVVPQTTFSQNDSVLIFQVDTMADNELSEDNWCISLLNRERFLLKVILKPPDLWMAHVKLLQSIKDDSLTINFQNSFRKVMITFKKPNQLEWKSLGSPLKGNNELMDSRDVSIDDFCTNTIIIKENVTHDVILLGVKPVASSLLHVPVGLHLKIRLPSDPDLSRKYTPVKRTLIQSQTENETEDQDPNLLYFLIKIYPDGRLTKPLGSQQIGSTLELGAVAGGYDHSFLRNCQTLVLFAGGTGITPFARILDFIKSRSGTYPISRIILVFFNHSEKDIIWKDQFTHLAKNWNSFHFFPVISTQSKEWTGLVGRVDDTTLFQSILQKTLDDEQPESTKSPRKSISEQLEKFKAMICGSKGFNSTCVTMLKKQTIVDVAATEEDVFLF